MASFWNSGAPSPGVSETVEMDAAPEKKDSALIVSELSEAELQDRLENIREKLTSTVLEYPVSHTRLGRRLFFKKHCGIRVQRVRIWRYNASHPMWRHRAGTFESISRYICLACGYWGELSNFR